MNELKELGQAVVRLPIQLFGIVVSLLTVSLTDIEMLTLVSGIIALGFATSPVIALAAGLLFYAGLRTFSEVINRHTEQIHFLALVIRDRDNLVRVQNLEDNDRSKAQD